MTKKQSSESTEPPGSIRSIISPIDTGEFPHEEIPPAPDETRLYEYDPSFSWPRKAWALCVVFGVILAIAAVVRLLMLRLLAVPGTVHMTPVDPRLVDLLGFAGSIVVAWIGGHETIHAGVCRWYGWDFDVIITRWGMPSIVSHHSYQTRRETMTMLLTPAIAITIACVGSVGLASLTPWVLSPYTTAGILLLCTFNLGGSTIDCYTVWNLRYLPAGTLLYTTDFRTLVAVPECCIDPEADEDI